MLNYAKMTIDDIIDWCKENNQVDWLKREAAKTTSYKVYPRIKAEDGNSWKADKTQKPTIEKRPISFFTLKQNFAEKFMPEILPKASKKKAATMYDKIAAL